jgi:hypothetical protein
MVFLEGSCAVTFFDFAVGRRVALIPIETPEFRT